MNRLILAVVLTLSACATQPETASSEAEAQDPPKFYTCEDAASYYQGLAGQKLGLVTFEPHRIIKPNSIVTLDYNPKRLNVYIDDDGVIEDSQCG